MQYDPIQGQSQGHDITRKLFSPFDTAPNGDRRIHHTIAYTAIVWPWRRAATNCNSRPLIESRRGIRTWH